MDKIIVRKEPMTDMDWHYTMGLDTFIRAIEEGEQTNLNTSMAFFVKVNPKTDEGEIYYKPAIHSLDTDYLRQMRDTMHFKYVMVFGGGGIEGQRGDNKRLSRIASQLLIDNYEEFIEDE